MKNILEYLKKYPVFCGGIVLFIFLFIIAMVKGAYTIGVMIIPLVLTYISWFCTEIDRNKILTLLEKVVNRYQDLVAKYNNLIDDYNKLVDAYKDLENPIEESEYDFSNLRPSWKPSEEQMRALNKVVNGEVLLTTQHKSLESLYEQLKKL